VPFIRNWILPILSSGLFALLGFMLIGLPGVNMVVTLDGTPMADGIPPEQVSTIIAEGRRIDSYLDFYGIHLPGEPLYWSIGVVVLMALLGYRLGSKLKVPRVDHR
jgi:hypothetical protein